MTDHVTTKELHDGIKHVIDEIIAQSDRSDRRFEQLVSSYEGIQSDIKLLKNEVSGIFKELEKTNENFDDVRGYASEIDAVTRRLYVLERKVEDILAG